LRGQGLRGVAQVVEYLPSMCEALSSIPTTVKKKKKKRKENVGGNSGLLGIKILVIQ
jgi:hypothetical protein